MPHLFLRVLDSDACFYVRPWKHNYNQHGLPQLLFLWRYCWPPGLLLRGAVPNATRMATNFRYILYESSRPTVALYYQRVFLVSEVEWMGTRQSYLDPLVSRP